MHVRFSFLVFIPFLVMASLVMPLPAWRRLAPRLAKDLICRQPLRNQGCAANSIRRFAAIPSPQPAKVRTSVFTDKSRQFFTSSSRQSAATPNFTSAIEEGAAQAQSKSSSFPKITDKSVAYWLLGSAASVFGIVVFGGLTRLTESGFVHKALPVDLYFNYQASDADGSTLTQIEYHRMAPRHWLYAAYERGRLGGGVFQVPCIPRVQALEPQHEPF